jgi:hypothetical protein
MKKLTLFPAVGLLLGVTLVWSALAPAVPYSGWLAARGAGLGEPCIGVDTVWCPLLSPECYTIDYVELCTTGWPYQGLCQSNPDSPYKCRPTGLCQERASEKCAR